MKEENKELDDSNIITIDRIKSAVSAGIKIKTIANESEITYFRIASVVNVESYRYKTSFTLPEIKRIHRTLDSIKASI